MSWRSDFPLRTFFGAEARGHTVVSPVSDVCVLCVKCSETPTPPSDSSKDIKPDKYLLVSVSHTAARSESFTVRSVLLEFGFLIRHPVICADPKHKQAAQTLSVQHLVFLVWVSGCSGWFVISFHLSYLYTSNKLDMWLPTPFITYQSQLAGHLINRFFHLPVCMQVNACCAGVAWCKSIILHVVGRKEMCPFLNVNPELFERSHQ